MSGVAGRGRGPSALWWLLPLGLGACGLDTTGTYDGAQAGSAGTHAGGGGRSAQLGGGQTSAAGSTSMGGVMATGGISTAGAGGKGAAGRATAGQGGRASGGSGSTIRCTSNVDCTAAGLICDLRRGACVECTSLLDCGAGKECRAGWCQAKRTCVNSLDCVDLNLVCNLASGQCVDCNGANDCQDGQACLGLTCRNPCSLDLDCLGDGLLCDHALGYCVECVTGADCPTPLVCTTGRCVSTGSGGTGGSAGAPGTGGGPLGGGSGIPGGAGGFTGGAGGFTGGGEGPLAGTAGDGQPGTGGLASGGSHPTGGAATSMCPGTGGTHLGGGGGPAGAAALIPATCGDYVRDPGESCDDGNAYWGDGCTPACRLEPDCSKGACVSVCGDGIVLGGEACDDGNNRSCDGCSSTCQVEPGFECHQPALGAFLQVPIVYRDFTTAHPDFQPANSDGLVSATVGLLLSMLDNQGKPMLAAAGQGLITSQESFARWYRDDADFNGTTVSVLTLWDNCVGGYVNRWGPNGERWLGYQNISWCADATCTSCNTQPTGGKCQNPCIPWDTAYCIAVPTYYDGNPVFFPIDDSPYNVTPSGDYSTATIAPAYGGDWTPESKLSSTSVLNHNFHFTSELHTWFLYQANKSYTLGFTGDDDVWVFINRQLAVDLGGIHTPVDGSVTLDTAKASELGLEDGKLYEIAVFQAERKTNSSTYRLTLTGFNTAPTVCTLTADAGAISCSDGGSGGGGAGGEGGGGAGGQSAGQGGQSAGTAGAGGH